MSASALFEFDIDLTKNTPEKLTDQINAILGTESSLSTSVDLASKEELHKRSSTEFPPGSEELNETGNTFLSDVQERLAKYHQEDTAQTEAVEYTPKRSNKKWELFLGYYIDEDEFPLFEKVVALILDVSIGDVFYFREPDAQGNCAYEDATEISIEDLRQYTPDMGEWETYVFRK